MSGPGRCPAHLSVIIPIEVTHKNVPSIAADFSPSRGPATASVLRAFLRLELHFDPRSCLARRGELTEPKIQHLLYVFLSIRSIFKLAAKS